MEFLGDKFVNAAGRELNREEAVGGYALVMVLYSASWCGGCTAFKGNLKTFYESWNQDGAKNV